VAALPPAVALASLPGLVPAIPSQVRAPSTDPDEIQLHFTVPERFAGAILGKGGAQVKQTAATAGCKVSMTTRDPGQERRAVIVGTYGQCAIAQGLLQEQLVEAARTAGQEINEVSVMFLVRKEAAGAVIGKQGAGLKQIREQSGAKIQLAREEVEGQRPCTITGPLQSVLLAEKGIFDAVRQVPVEATGAAPPDNAYLSVAYPGYEAGVKRQEDVHAGGDVAAFMPTAKRQRVEDSEAPTKLLVPAQSAGAVIGKQGSGLKEIRETTGAHVDMLQQAQAPQWPNDRVVILKGSSSSRQAAVLALLRTAFQMYSDSCSLKMLVSPSQAGSVIGRQGGTLKRIREQCGVSVQVEREEILGERLVTSTGAMGQVSAAAVAIMQALESQGPAPETSSAAQAGAGPAYAAYHQPAMAAGGAYIQQPVPPTGVPGYYEVS